MSILLQRIFIFVLNPLYEITGQLSENVRNTIIQIICLLFPAFFLMQYSGVFNGTVLESIFAKSILGMLLFVLLIIFSVDRPLKTIIWRNTIAIPMFLAGIGIIFTGCIHTVGSGFQLFGFQLIFFFPCLALVWNNRGDYETLFRSLARGIVVSLYIYLAICYVLALCGEFHMDGGRWPATMVNVNILCQYGVNVMFAGLYLVLEGEKRIVCKLLYICAAGAGIGFVILGLSRTSFLSVGVGLAAIAVYVYVRRNQFHLFDRDKKAVGRRTLCFALCLLFSALVYIGLPAVQKATAQDYQGRTEVSISDRLGSGNYSSTDKFTSGRVTIWKNYARHLNLTGNDFDSTNWSELTDLRAAHNIFLGVGYRSGILVAALFVFIQVVAGLLVIGILFDKKISNPAYLFFILFYIQYLIESTIDVAIMPFHRYTVLLFYIGLMCVIPRRIAMK